MKQIQVMLVLIGVSMTLLGQPQRSAPDRIKTAKGPLIVQPILHGTVVFTWDGKTIYIDPYGGAKAFSGIEPPDLIIITDIHGDHMNIETLRGLEIASSTIVAPKAVADQLPEEIKNKLIVIGNGERTSQAGVDIEAMPMYNLPETADSRHPRGRGNGYVLTFGDKRVYISGDTEDIPEMRALKDIDVAFVCMNGPTMDVKQASNAVVEFKPRIVYPFHHRGSDIGEFRNLVLDNDGTIEVRLRNWYPTYE